MAGAAGYKLQVVKSLIKAVIPGRNILINH